MLTEWRMRYGGEAGTLRQAMEPMTLITAKGFPIITTKVTLQSPSAGKSGLGPGSDKKNGSSEHQQRRREHGTAGRFFAHAEQHG